MKILNFNVLLSKTEISTIELFILFHPLTLKVIFHLEAFIIWNGMVVLTCSCDLESENYSPDALQNILYAFNRLIKSKI